MLQRQRPLHGKAAMGSFALARPHLGQRAPRCDAGPRPLPHARRHRRTRTHGRVPSQADDPYAEFLKVPQWPTRADCASCYTIEIVHPRGTPPVPVVNEAGIAAYLDGLYCHDAEAPCWAMGDGAEDGHPERARQRFASVMAIALVACMLFIACRGCGVLVRGAKRKKEEDMV